MKGAIRAILLLVVASVTNAAAEAICPGDAKLSALIGIWVQPRFLNELHKSRSWHTALGRVDAQTVSVRIAPTQVYFNLAWHEGDPGGHCVKRDGKKLWVRPASQPNDWLGPYVRTSAKSEQDEAAVYLNTFFHGCFKSEAQQRWCLSPTSISVDGRKVAAALQMDLSEGPNYGTAFKTALSSLPFTVFVPRKRGWAVYQDDWVTAESEQSIDPASSKPWRELTK